ncbi:hypothetical protein JW964_13340 [candidate division KSB1 bacterium]|nr:hypothetical protein [candidate division KSB1 bacterium]
MFKSIFMKLLIIFIFVFNGIGVAQEVLEIKPTFEQVKALTIYEVKLTCSQPLPADAKFQFTFPAAMDLSKVRMAGSATINGGFKTQAKGNQVIIERSGLGDTIPANTPIELMFTSVINPEQAGNFVIKGDILTSDGKLFFNKQGTVVIKEKK